MPLIAVVLALALAFSLAGLLAAKKIINLPDPTFRVGHIDGIRGYLAFFVCCHHFYIWTDVLRGGAWDKPSSYIFANFGEASVDLFFMITGTLFYPKIMSGIKSTNWRSFYISRFFRLAPILWAVVLCVVILILLVHGKPPKLDCMNSLNPIARSLSFLGSDDIFNFKDTWRMTAGVSWSLRCEWEFYFSVPFLALIYSFLQNKMIKLYFSVLLVLVLLILFGFTKILNAYPESFTYIPLFLIGMLACQLAENRTLKVYMSGPLVALVGIAALLAEAIGFSGAFGAPQYVLLAVFYVPLALGNSYFGALSAKPSRALGELSYSIYLTHGMLLYGFMTVESKYGFRPTPDSGLFWLYLPFLVAVVIVVSALSHILVELPGMRLGKKILVGGLSH